MRAPRRLILAVVTLVLIWLSPERAQEPVLPGFTSLRSRQERELERRFMTVPDSQTAESVHAFLSREPHFAGSPEDRRNADYVLERFRQFGFDAALEDFDVLLSEPREIKVELLEIGRASCRERV